MIGVAMAALLALHQRSLTPSEREAIAAKVKLQLRDPDSARFTWWATKSGSKYCGMVNSKNGLGGYSGPITFMVVLRPTKAGLRPDPYTPVSFVNDDLDGDLVRRVCLGIHSP